MPSLKDLRDRIKSVQTTKQTTKAMKMVAASKLRRAQEMNENLRPYAEKMQSVMARLAAESEEGASSPYAEARELENVLFVVVTSNRGLCGAFNNNIIKLAEGEINEKYAAHRDAGKLKIMGLGRKGYEHFKRREYDMVETEDVFAKLNFDKVEPVAALVMDGFLDKKWDKVVLFYNKFKNVATQIRTVENFLPIDVEKAQEGGPEEEGRQGAQSGGYANDFIFEPSGEELMTSLIPRILKIQFYKAVLESNASEHGARMVAMDNATENAEDLIKELKLSFNKARQAAITKEILEIVSGANALEN